MSPGHRLSGDKPWTCEVDEDQSEFICKDKPTVSCAGPGDKICDGQPTGPCVDQRFNGSSIRVCEPNPFTYAHTYQCAKASGTCSYNISVTITDSKEHTKNVGAIGVPVGTGGLFGP